jgi:hypothetical protein
MIFKAFYLGFIKEAAFFPGFLMQYEQILYHAIRFHWKRVLREMVYYPVVNYCFTGTTRK